MEFVSEEERIMVKKSDENSKNVNDKVNIAMEDLKAVFGDRFKVGYLKASVIPNANASLMIPGNEPCPTEPHNHDRLSLDHGFQKVIVIEL
jgi:hypothetical protein